MSNPRIIFLALLISLASINAQTVELNCYFIEVWGIYTCRMPNVRIESDNENQNIVITGIHLPGRGNADVVNVEIHDSRTTFIVTQAISTFVNMNGMQIFSSELNRIQPNAFANAANLETLEITGNPLTSLGASAFLGTRLTWLDLDSNQIESIHQNAFAGLPTLRELNLTRNRIQELHPNVFSPLSSLTFVTLEYNQLLRIPSQLFANNLPLVEIALGWNQINAVGPTFIEHLQFISTFRFAVNQCASISYINLTPESLRANVRLGLATCMENYGEVPTLPPPEEGVRRFILEVSGILSVYDDNGTQVVVLT